MNKRKKIISIFLSFFILFNSFNISYADSSVDTRSGLVLGSYVISQQAFNIIVGFAVSSGIVLTTLNDKYDFVTRFYDSYTNIKSDSGVFQTEKDFEELIKKDAKKQPSGSNGNNNNFDIIVVGSSILGVLKSVFDSIFNKSDSDTIYYNGTIPFYPKFYYPKYTSESTTVFNFRGYNMKFSYVPSDRYPYKFDVNGHSQQASSMYGLSLQKVRDNYYNCLTHPTGFQAYITNSGKYGDTPKEFYIPSEFEGNYSPTSSNKFNDEVIDEINHPVVKPSEVIELPIIGNDDNESDKPSVDEDIKFPGFPDIDLGNLNLEPLTVTFDKLKGKFPFSIPSDIYNLLSVFRADPLPPKFTFTLLSHPIDIDLGYFDEWANIVRMFIVFSWVFLLFSFTKKVGE